MKNLLFFLIIFILLGCAPKMITLKLGAQPSYVNEQIEKKFLPIPVLIDIRAPNSLPARQKELVPLPTSTIYQYSLKLILEKVFQDVIYNSFVKPEKQIGQFCEIEVNVPVARLEYTGNSAIFYLETNAIFRDQRGNIVEMANLTSTTQSTFDGKTIPKAVWDAAYQVANEFVNTLFHSAKIRQIGQTKRVTVHKKESLAIGYGSSLLEQNRTIERKPISTLPQLPQYDNYIALIVGVSHYKNIAHLPYPEKDIELMKEVVTKIMGVKKKNLYVIKNPTKAEIIVHIKKITRLANNYKNPKVIFYFSGHGTTYTEKEGKGEGYLLPIEADPEDIPTTALALAEVEKLLGEVKGEKVVIIDACFSGKGKSILPAGKPFIGIKKITPKIEYTTILLSSEENEISTYIKDKGISTFTYALYEMMAKYGPVLDENKNGWLEVKEIAKKLIDFTDDYAIRFANKHQHPVIRGYLDISLAQCP
ncbi:MAG: caspase family protein [Candidatus Desulfofervidus auxilii]|nr:caspase family protein [Candidatus Desulfofervidus auxilii]